MAQLGTANYSLRCSFNPLGLALFIRVCFRV